MTETMGYSPEDAINLENTNDITVQSLLRENASYQAEEQLKAWESARKYGNLTGIRKCGDARSITPLPESSAAIGSIAAGGDFDSYKRLYDFNAFRDFIAMGHYDGETIGVAKSPSGCGGLAAKAEINKGNDLNLRDVQTYLENGVAHPDVVVQTFLSASEIAKRTDKDVLAVAQDHRDGTLFPFALFSTRTSQFKSSINPEFLLHKYDPTQIYKMGFIPSLPDSELPAHFQHILREYQKQQAEIIQITPNLSQHQKTQNPEMVYFSTDIRPVELKFPQLAVKPNRIFQLNVPRTRIDNGIHIDDISLDNVICQAEYPITHATENKDNPQASFSKTKTFYVETGEFDQSLEIAKKLLERPWMKKWLEIEGNQIIVAKSRAGKIEAIQKYSPEL